MDFKFYCKKEEITVIRSKCTECVAYDECQCDGYLEEVDTKYVLQPHQLVRKWINRAAKYRKDPKHKTWCDRKIQGCADYEVVGKVPSKERIASLLKDNDHHFDAEKVWKVTRSYFIQKAIWGTSAAPGDYKEKYREVLKALTKAKESLETLRDKLELIRLGFYSDQEDKFIDLYTTLQSESGVKLNNYFYQTGSLHRCLDDIVSEESNTLPKNFPIFQYINKLSDVYQEETGEPPTATDGKITGKASPFVLFVHALLSEFHPEVFAG